MKRIILAGAVAGVMYLLAGCGTSENQKSTATDSTATAQVVKTTDTVVIEGMQFKPAQLTIHKGDTIVWINNDIVAHSVTEDTAQTWTSDTINIGATWTMSPQSSFNYLCSFHPTMKGSVTVVEK
ncbi:MAG TPA: plastocyanin/azurin family copper-binding protein [Bacteroidia bacterium]|nr:MAG: amicyanin [Bacteroidetes bacterium OLB10]MBE7509620.1 cupredoxin domain-containing protein [Bacteroidia bacterium]MBX3107034.1 cupredoxin domain-containing protein [Bacteroidota bacterium]OQB59898.1 MAG: Amicyanin precursor [Bacteroidetes bacterium ADurb.Bin141]MBV6453535.1 hypothetical protein [Bacteroidia bacterium]